MVSKMKQQIEDTRVGLMFRKGTSKRKVFDIAQKSGGLFTEIFSYKERLILLCYDHIDWGFFSEAQKIGKQYKAEPVCLHISYKFDGINRIEFLRKGLGRKEKNAF